MNKYTPKNILVTGGAGFIGSHFIRLLLQQRHYFIVNLDLLTYAGSLDNLADIENNSDYLFVKGNITDKELVLDLLQRYCIDTIVHFAAESHVDRSILQPDAFIQTNIVGTYSLLEAAKHYWQLKYQLNENSCRFHHISTDEVYGSLGSNDRAFTENSAYDPSSPYSASKASADFLVRSYYKTYKLPITLSNCSNNFGPYQHPEKFIPVVINSCLLQKPISIYGDGSNIRDWLYVEDHCQAIDKILHFGEVGETYNIGSQNEKSNLEIAKIICSLMDEIRPTGNSHDDLITFVTDRPGHDWRYAINPEKIYNNLSWHAEFNFNNALRKTITWYSERNFS